MKTRSILFLVALFSFSPGIVRADEKPIKKPAEEADAALAELAGTKRAAVLMLEGKGKGRRVPLFPGVFISKDGLALVNLSALARDEKPTVYTGFDALLEFGTILGVFPEQELALMKFKHRPEVWLDLAPVEPAVDETIAIVPLSMEDPWKGRIPPIIGPIMVKRSAMTSNLRVNQFTRVMSLGSGLSMAQRTGFMPGVFAVDRKGRLVAFTSSIRMTASQSLIFVSPVEPLVNPIRTLAAGGKAIPFPLPKDLNPIDLALLDEDFRTMHLAIQNRNEAEAQRYLEKLLKRYPTSDNLKVLATTEPALRNPARPVKGPDVLQFNPAQPAAQQVTRLGARAMRSLMKGEIKSGIRDLESAIDPELCPPAFTRHREMLAAAYVKANRLNDAERIYRETYPLLSDSIDFVEDYESLLIKRGRFEEADKMTQRVFELEAIYRR